MTVQPSLVSNMTKHGVHRRVSSLKFTPTHSGGGGVLKSPENLLDGRPMGSWGQDCKSLPIQNPLYPRGTRKWYTPPNDSMEAPTPKWKKLEVPKANWGSFRLLVHLQVCLKTFSWRRDGRLGAFGAGRFNPSRRSTDDGVFSLTLCAATRQVEQLVTFGHFSLTTISI